MRRPELGDPLKTTDQSEDVLRFLSERRSNLAKVMQGDRHGPSAKQLTQILELAARVPDHRKLAPWRFVTFTGQARASFGDILADAFKAEDTDPAAHKVAFERERFLRAHTVVAVISSPKPCKKGTPVWEQELSSGAVCFQILLAARAMGLAAQWLSEWYAYSPQVNAALELTDAEKIAGYMYIGAASEPPKERARPDVSALIREF